MDVSRDTCFPLYVSFKPKMVVHSTFYKKYYPKFLTKVFRSILNFYECRLYCYSLWGTIIPMLNKPTYPILKLETTGMQQKMSFFDSTFMLFGYCNLTVCLTVSAIILPHFSSVTMPPWLNSYFLIEYVFFTGFSMGQQNLSVKIFVKPHR